MSNNLAVELAAKLIVIDLDGTMTTGNSWQKLNTAMGATVAEDDYYYDLYAAHKITYQQWVDALIDIYRRRSIPTKETLSRQLLQYSYIPWARQTVAEMKRRGYNLAIISGAIDIFVNAVANDLGIDTVAYNTTFYFDTEERLQRVEVKGDDAPVKLAQLQAICQERKISLEECICIGDSPNDRLIFEATGRGITFEHCKKIHDCSWKVVKDWTTLLAALEVV